MIRRTLIVISGVIAILVMVFLATQLGRSRNEASPLPNPNGYDDFLKAAEVLKGDYGSYSRLDHEELSKMVFEDAQALELVRLGLSRQCAVPPVTNIATMPTELENLSKMKNLGFLLLAESRLAEKESRPADAARICVETIRFGVEISRRGMVIHRLVGIAMENLGRNALTPLLPKLGHGEALPLITELEKVDSAYVNLDKIWQAENRFFRQHLGPVKHALMGRPMQWWFGRGTRKKSEEKHNNALADLRLLRAELALNCYRSKHGRVPERLEQLVPDLLKEVPVSLLTGRPMVYRPDGTNWILNGN